MTIMRMNGIDRRQLLKTAALTAATLPAQKFFSQTSEVTKVFLVAKCHLDVGFVDLQRNIMRKYFDVYFPQAIDLAARQKDAGKPYMWTTGSWLVYEYLEQANATQRKAMEQAIADRAIAWHALPFSWQTELMPPSLIEGGISFSEELDRRFGTKTTGAKMTDVPGHTRGIVAPLVKHGVRMLDIGVNAASTAPEVPDIFRWQDTTGAELVMVYHRADYGGTVVVPGAGIAYSMQVRGDNSGPHKPEEIDRIYSDLRAKFPGAKIIPASLTDVAEAIAPHASNLPIFKQEIGDTWIHGIASDPPKLTEFREFTRLREQWLGDGTLKAGSDADRGFLRRFLLGAEHTGGLDTKIWIDYDHYRPADLRKAKESLLHGYAEMETSWQEKRDDLRVGLAALSAAQQRQAMIAVQRLVPVQPVVDGMHPVRVGDRIETPAFDLTFDARGAINGILDKDSHRMWATPTHPLALFTYQTLSQKEFADFIALYLHSKEDWAYKDFGKPNIDHFNAQSSEWHPQLRGLWTDYKKPVRRVVAEMVLAPAPSTASAPVLIGNISKPQAIYTEFAIHDDGRILITFTMLGKPENRMPEAMWLTFSPNVPAGTDGWEISKSGQRLALNDVVRGGSRAMHAVDDSIRWQGSDGNLHLTTYDAPLIAFDRRTPICYTPNQPSLKDGFHINLYNNAWGTNYPQWRGGDWSYRFELRLR